MKAVVLAGGFGTRLRPLTYTTPKPMLPVANKPIIDHTVERLTIAGIKEVIITTNYLWEQIQTHIEKSEYGIPVKVFKEEKPLGTSGSVRRVKRKLDGDFLVIQGDSISSIDISHHISSHKGMATISLTKVENPSQFGIVGLDSNNRVKSFVEKPGPREKTSGLANTGTYTLSYDVLDYIPKGKSDFSLDIFPKLITRRKHIYGLLQEGYWRDVGSIRNYFSGNKYMLGGILSGNIGKNVFLSRKAKIMPPCIIGNNSHIGQDVTIGPNTVIGNNCHIGSKSKIVNSILFDSVKIGSNCSMEHCIIGDKTEFKDDVYMGPWTVVGSGCVIERNVNISQWSKLGPIIKVQASTQVQGVVTPNIQKIEKVKSMLEKIPTFKKLERDELQVCMTLLEFGELGSDVLGTLSRLPKDQVDKALTKLQNRGIIRGDEGMFSLLYEDPNKIYGYLKGKISKL